MKAALVAGFGTQLALVCAGWRKDLPDNCLVVSKPPGRGQFDTVQRAVDSLSTTSDVGQCITIERGEYIEGVYGRARLTVFGETAAADDRAAAQYADNMVTLKANITPGAVETGIPDPSALGYYGCQIRGRRAALPTASGHQLYVRCLVQGNKDLVYVNEAAAWFERSDISLLEVHRGYITANGKRSADDKSIFVFNQCNVSSVLGTSAKQETYFLGHPKGAFAQVVFQNTDLPKAINPRG
ncbi:pectinesterase [Colletotrichum salicis]|uniref:pectinesterase n=1 Tax=Colletotrichum salicis TaxID=1209931 RepID=A0A135U589_9PEZI|nr:pectinesterase [Colletotrichum salicis]